MAITLGLNQGFPTGVPQHHGGGTFSKVGGTSARQKIYNIFVIWIENCDVTSIEIWCHYPYTPYEGLINTILDKITPLRKRIGEPPEIEIGRYRGDSGQKRHSGSSYDLFWLNKTVRRLRHWNFHLLSFWLALSLLCDVNHVTINEKFSW